MASQPQPQALPITPTMICMQCMRTRLVGDRWGSGTRDAYGRYYCSDDCAWTVLFREEAPSHVTHTATMAPSRRKVKRRSSRTTSGSNRIAATSTATALQRPSSSKQQQQASSPDEWHAMLGMSALLGFPLDN